MNDIKFFVYNDGWEDLSKYLVYPIKLADLLDERLDEAEIELKNTPVEYFRQMTLVKIQIVNTPSAVFSQAYYQKVQDRAETPIDSIEFSRNKITETLTRYYIVATDNANEKVGLKFTHGVNNGKKVYNHQIYLIELTKIAEGFIGDPLSFTNALGNDYIGG